MREERQENFIEIFYNEDFSIFKDPRYRQYRKEWIEFPKKRYVGEYPANLDVFITNRCNLKCIMCRRTIANENKERKFDSNLDMDYALFQKLIDETGDKVPALHITSFGEPLIHPRLCDMIKYARDKGMIDVFFNTNAVFLKGDLAENLIRSGLTRLLISFDSPVKETYERIRRGAKFEKVYNNILEFMELRKKMNSTYPIVRVQMVEMAQNTKETDLFKEMFKDVVDVIGFSEHVTYDTDVEDDRNLEKKEENYDFVDEQLWQRISVDVDGTVYACLAIRDDMVLGNLADKKLKELWQGERMTFFRKKHIHKKCREIEGCSKCGRRFKHSERYQ
ncbi:radical SAM/SPASM domain-containing protein [Thermodesulfobacteriota bacterium]